MQTTTQTPTERFDIPTGIKPRPHTYEVLIVRLAEQGTRLRRAHVYVAGSNENDAKRQAEQQNTGWTALSAGCVGARQ